MSNSTESALNRTPRHVTELKHGILDLALPAESAVVFGDVWRVEGAYARRCSESYGCIAERRAPNPRHWSRLPPEPGLFDLGL